MTLIAFAVFVDSTADVPLSLERARLAARSGARVVEWRIDTLAEEPEALPAIERLVRESPLPCIVTCRPATEGGLYEGEEADRIMLFEHLAASDAQPRYLDVELAAYTRSMNLRQKVNLAVDHAKQARDLHTSLILSSHEFTGRPPDLLQRVARMAEEQACAVIKIVWTARSLRDNLEVFDLLRARPKPMIALCMGPYGLMSRVLAPKFGGLLTYATDSDEGGTAPGQPTIHDLRGRFRFETITRSTRVYGVIGWPVEHSRGPDLHNAGFERVGHDGVYLPLPIPPEYEHFKATLGALLAQEALDLRGASVTMPHKEHLPRFAREQGATIDPLVEIIGAANTLIVDDAGALAIRNTDAPAVVASLCAGMDIQPSDLRGLRIAVLGAGGMARAVVAGLSAHGASIVLFNRSRERAEALARDVHGKRLGAAEDAPSAHVVAGDPASLGCGCFPVFINATPIGMTGGPAADENPLELLVDGERDSALHEAVTVFDTVYTPERTPLIREAETRGARVITGSDLFLRQAAMQFEAWTGREAPLESWRELLRAR